MATRPGEKRPKRKGPGGPKPPEFPLRVQEPAQPASSPSGKVDGLEAGADEFGLAHERGSHRFEWLCRRILGWARVSRGRVSLTPSLPPALDETHAVAKIPQRILCDLDQRRLPRRIPPGQRGHDIPDGPEVHLCRAPDGACARL